MRRKEVIYSRAVAGNKLREGPWGEALKNLRETFATFRQPLGLLLVLVGGGAGLAALTVVLLPALPIGVQQSATNALGWVPGLYRGLEMSREDPQLTGSLRLEAGERIVARFPATDEGWSRHDSCSVWLELPSEPRRSSLQ